jgi:hypothetical protein
MTARVSRLSGALIVSTSARGEPAWFLVGDTKSPCDWAASGFEAPRERDVLATPVVRLAPSGAPSFESASLTLALEGEEAARAVAERLLVPRNGSVSERLWRLIFGADDESPEGDRDARWLTEIPDHVWDVVRNAVLKCT